MRILQLHNILERAKWTHFYVVCDEHKIIGCGAIGPYWDKEDESSLFTIRPLAKLSKAIEIADTSNQGEAKRKAFSAVTVTLG